MIANAQLLCGYVTGLLSHDADDTEEGGFACQPLLVGATRTSIVVETRPDKLRFRITFEQIGDGD